MFPSVMMYRRQNNLDIRYELPYFRMQCGRKKCSDSRSLPLSSTKLRSNPLLTSHPARKAGQRMTKNGGVQLRKNPPSLPYKKGSLSNVGNGEYGVP